MNPASQQFFLEEGYSGTIELLPIILERWYDMPFVTLKYYDENIFYDLSYALKRALASLGYLPLEEYVLHREFLEPFNESILKDGVVIQINVRVSLDNSLIDFWTLTNDEKVLYSLPIEHLNLENLSTLLAELLRRSGYDSSFGLLTFETPESTENVTKEFLRGLPDTFFIGKDRQPKIISGYGLPFFKSDKVDYIGGLVTYSGEFYELTTEKTHDNILESVYGFPVFRTSTRQLYIDRVTEGRKVVWQNVRLLGIWDGIVLFADGSISDTSLSWRMKVSQTPVDFLVYDGVLVIVDVASNFYALDLKTRRLLYNDHVPDFRRLRVTDSGVVLETESKALLFDKSFKNKSVLTSAELTKSASYIFYSPVYPSVMGVVKTKIGYFFQDIFVGTEIFLFFVKSNKIYLLTDVGTWIYDLGNQ